MNKSITIKGVDTIERLRKMQRKSHRTRLTNFSDLLPIWQEKNCTADIVSVRLFLSTNQNGSQPFCIFRKRINQKTRWTWFQAEKEKTSYVDICHTLARQRFSCSKAERASLPLFSPRLCSRSIGPQRSVSTWFMCSRLEAKTASQSSPSLGCIYDMTRSNETDDHGF